MILSSHLAKLREQVKRVIFWVVSCFERSAVVSETSRSIFNALRLTLRAQPRSEELQIRTPPFFLGREQAVEFGKLNLGGLGVLTVGGALQINDARNGRDDRRFEPVLPYGLPSPGPAPLPCSVMKTIFEVMDSETTG